MRALSGQAIEIQRHCCNQRLALAGLHFRDLALVQHNAADQLDVERQHIPLGLDVDHLPFFAQQPTTGLFNKPKCLRHDIIERFAVLYAFPELFALLLKVNILILLIE